MTVQRDHVDIVQSKEFDVVSSDIGLPDGSGYDVISEAKRKQPVKGVAILYPTRTKASGEAKKPASIFTSPKRWTSTRCAESSRNSAVSTADAKTEARLESVGVVYTFQHSQRAKRPEHTVK